MGNPDFYRADRRDDLPADLGTPRRPGDIPPIAAHLAGAALFAACVIGLGYAFLSGI